MMVRGRTLLTQYVLSQANLPSNQKRSFEQWKEANAVVAPLDAKQAYKDLICKYLRAEIDTFAQDGVLKGTLLFVQKDQGSTRWDLQGGEVKLVQLPTAEAMTLSRMVREAATDRWAWSSLEKACGCSLRWKERRSWELGETAMQISFELHNHRPDLQETLQRHGITLAHRHVLPALNTARQAGLNHIDLFFLSGRGATRSCREQFNHEFLVRRIPPTDFRIWNQEVARNVLPGILRDALQHDLPGLHVQQGAEGFFSRHKEFKSRYDTVHLEFGFQS